MKKLHLIGALCAVAFGFISLSTHAALVSAPGGLAVYDTDRDISWVANANLAATNTFGLATGVSLGTYPGDISSVNGVINADGTMNWPGALFWIDAMNAANYLGFNDWRLPITPQPDATCDIQEASYPGYPTIGSSTGCTGSEMGHLYNVEGVTAALPGLFLNVQAAYWSGTEFPPDTLSAWNTFFTSGAQAVNRKSIDLFFAWAVRSGDVSAAPGSDSDGDGLSYADEIALGTDPGSADTDGDGIEDGSDPDIIATAINTLPLDPSAFANRGDPAGHRNAMLSRLTDIQSDIASGDIEQALRALRNLRTRVNGCGASPDRNDWIIDCVAQLEIRRLIDLLITNLES